MRLDALDDDECLTNCEFDPEFAEDDGGESWHYRDEPCFFDEKATWTHRSHYWYWHRFWLRKCPGLTA